MFLLVVSKATVIDRDRLLLLANCSHENLSECFVTRDYTIRVHSNLRRDRHRWNVGNIVAEREFDQKDGCI